MTRPLICLAALALCAGASASAQTLGQRVARVRDGTVRFSFASRPDVCGSPRGGVTVRYGGERASTRTVTSSGATYGNRGRDEWEVDCEPGPVRVAVETAGGSVIEVRTYVGGRWRAAGDAADLGTVTPREAADYLLDLATRGQGRGSRDAIFPATLAEGIVTWPRLIEIAKNEALERSVRHQAIFWVGQAAEEKATEGLKEVIGNAAEDRDVRTQAVFALSQRPRDEAVPALINIARTSRDPEVRRTAIFWLAGTRDPRAVEYFESVLRR